MLVAPTSQYGCPLLNRTSRPRTTRRGETAGVAGFLGVCAARANRGGSLSPLWPGAFRSRAVACIASQRPGFATISQITATSATQLNRKIRSIRSLRIFTSSASGP